MKPSDLTDQQHNRLEAYNQLVAIEALLRDAAYRVSNIASNLNDSIPPENYIVGFEAARTIKTIEQAQALFSQALEKF